MKPVNPGFVGPQGQAADIIGWIGRVIGDQQIRSQKANIPRKPEKGRLLTEIEDHQQALVLEGAGKGIDLCVFWQDQVVSTINHDRRGLSQANQFLVIIKDGIGVRQSLFDIDPGVIGIDFEPGRAGGKPGILTGSPLHRGAGIVATFGMDQRQDGAGVLSLFIHVFMVEVNGFDVVIILDRLESHIRHANFFALVNIRRALQHMQESAQ